MATITPSITHTTATSPTKPIPPSIQSAQPIIPSYISSCIGAAAGVCEIGIQQPTIAIKNAIQTGRSIPWSPSELYRGVTINMLSIAPITGTQFTVNNILTAQFISSHTHQLTSIQQILFSSVAGGVSGLISGPAELILIQQQQTGYTLLQQLQYITTHHSNALYRRGLISAVTRDGLFTCGYLGLTPVLQSYITKSPYSSTNNTVNNIVGSLLAGISIGILSHPIDTIKTKIQSTLVYQHNGYNTMLQSIYTTIQHDSVRSLFNGLLPRTIRICGATFIISEVNKLLTKQYIDRIA